MISPILEFKLSLYINGLARAYRYTGLHYDYRNVSNVHGFIDWLKKKEVRSSGKSRFNGSKYFIESDIVWLKSYLMVLGGRKDYRSFMSHTFKKGILRMRTKFLEDFAPPNFSDLVSKPLFVVDPETGAFLKGFHTMEDVNSVLRIDGKKKLEEGVQIVNSTYFSDNFLVIDVRKANMMLYQPFKWLDYQGLSDDGVMSVDEILERGK